MAPRRLQDVFKTYPQDVFSVTIFFSSKTSSRRLARCLQDVFKTSSKTTNCYTEDILKTSSRYVLKTYSRRLEDQEMFAGHVHLLFYAHLTLNADLTLYVHLTLYAHLT